MSILRHLRMVSVLRGASDLTDGELLEAFVVRRDGASFEAMVRRHGPMVFGVCRRVLAHRQDAEDAFQATFIVLARKAGDIAAPERLGSWLYGVAHRTAMEARRLRANRRAHERQVDDMPHLPSAPEEPGQDLGPVLTEEIARLPERHRLPIVLCDLEGRTRRAVARQLGIPDGTLSNRLTAARRALAKRLTDRGIALTATTIAAALSGVRAAAAPAALIKSTAAMATEGVAPEVVVTLAEGVLNAMSLSKLVARLKTLSVVLLAVAAAGAVLVLARPAAPAPIPPADIPTVAQLTEKLGERVKGFKSLSVEYTVATKADVDPKRLAGWSMQLTKEFKFEHKVAFVGDKRSEAEVIPEQEFIRPLDEIEPDPLAPDLVKRQAQQTRDIGKKAKEAGDRRLGIPNMSTEGIYDGRELWVNRNGGPFGRPVDGPGGPRFSGQVYFFTAPYLEGVWLRPPSPLAGGDQLKAEEAHRLPDCLKHFATVTARPKTEAVDEAACVVLRAERAVKEDNEWSWESRYFGRNRTEVLTWWLDPALGYAPRRSEVRTDGLLAHRWEHSGFKEVAPGCWLPKESRWTRGTPAWVEKDLRDKPAFTQTFTVTASQVNDVPETLFRVVVDPVTGRGKRDDGR